MRRKVNIEYELQNIDEEFKKIKDFFLKSIVAIEKNCYYNALEDFEEKQEKLKQEYEKKYSEDFFNGYIQGLLDSNSICPRCKKNKIGSYHHIQPRKYFGQDEPENIIALCNECHNIIEEYTEELYHKQGYWDIQVLKNYILQGFPNE